LKEHGILRPETDDAYALERQVRAHLGYPKSRLKIQNIDVIITSAKVVETATAAPLVLTCAGGTYLAITELVAPSGKLMSGEAFLRGYIR
jgi:methionyl-tRNA formyltransferase